MAAISLHESSGLSELRVSAGGTLTVFFPEERAGSLREFGRRTEIFAEGTLRESTDLVGSVQGGAPGGSFVFFAQSMHVTKTASALERFRTGIRMNLIKRFDNYKWGGLALALLVGIRDSLDVSLAQQYRNAGCSYILALSGMHLAVITALLAFMLKKPLGLKAASIISGLIIIIYCFVVGPMPSLNRAAIMYLLGVLALAGALPRDAIQLLAISFLIQITATPHSGYSISFILSYSAMAGILVIGKVFSGLLGGIAPSFILHPLSASVGAFLPTAGITAFFFGILRPISIIAGLILMPLTTVFMIGSILFLVLDLVSPLLSGILNPPLTLLYAIMEKTVTMAGFAPGIGGFNPLIILAVSIGVCVLLSLIEIKRRRTSLRLLPLD
jgi:competence protein ComEC